MKKQKYQSGFAHLGIITVILAVAVVGLLGFVFYQNFIANAKKDKVVHTNSTLKNDTNKSVKYNTYKDDIFDGVSFKYLSNWSISEPDTPMADDPHWNRSVKIMNEKGQNVAQLILGVSGLGGTCTDDNGNPVLTTFTVLDTTASTVKAKKPVSVVFMVTRSTYSGYEATYGLMNGYDKAGDYNVCMMYNTFESTIPNDYGTYGMSFGNGISSTNHFANIEDAKKYIQSDEYKEIKKMLLSLSY